MISSTKSFTTKLKLIKIRPFRLCKEVTVQIEEKEYKITVFIIKTMTTHLKEQLNLKVTDLCKRALLHYKDRQILPQT